MSISCKCLNIVVKLVGPEAEHLERFDLESYLINRRNQQEPANQLAIAAAAKATTPSDDHFLFFKEALGPVRCSNVQVQFDGLLRKDRIFDEWDLSQCRCCDSFVFARHLADDASTDVTAAAMITCLINSSLMTNEEQLSARMAGGNYSPAFGIVLNGPNLSYSDLTEKGKLLSKAKSDNQFMQRLRAYMEQETETANERIQRFTEQEFTVLKVKRERAEQECLILAKLASAANNQVPDELLLVRSNSSTSSSSNNGGQQMTTVAGPGSSSNGTTLNDSGANSQLETPPPTPEYLPMSTGNSPPMATANGHATNTRQQPITPSSSSSMVDQSPFSSANARLMNGRTPNRANLSYNNANNHHIINNNNNNIVSYNNSRGAINNRQQPQPQQQQPATTLMQHSSTNSLTMQHRVASSYEADCMFDIDGMENDNSPLSNTLSDEEELGFDESIGNNNEDGIYIPSRQLGRQNNSTARSLPIAMPQLMTQFRTNEEDFEEQNEDNVDIAASIKALARSVHGDTVFGDLPRPQIQRFSTQI